MRLTSWLLMLPLASATFAQAEIYRWVNDAGQVEYSDRYREGAERVEVREPTTITLPKPVTAESMTESAAEPALQDLKPYQTLAITFPEPDSSFHSGNGDFSVTVSVQPALLPAHSLRLSLDGVQVGLGRTTTFALTNVDRGTHTLQLDVIDSTRVIQAGVPVTFTLHRPSILLRPGNAPTPKPSN